MPTPQGCTLCGGNDHARSECSWSGAPDEREAFRAAHSTLDLNEKADAWGRDQFLYSHVEATWRGWQAGAAWQRAQPAGVPDVSAMARVLSDRSADACNIDRTDNWAMYGQEYIEDVRAMLAASTGREVGK